MIEREGFLSGRKPTMSNQPDYSLEQRYGQAGRNLARRLAAYLPMTVTRQILNEELPQPGQVRWIQAATLFADISGFTTMAEALAVDGPRGAETLNRRLLMTFTALINAIHDAGGAVSHFHGDAMMVYFTDADGRAAGRALGCARFMQSLMLTSYSEFNPTASSSSRTTFSLTMRIGLGYGRCMETVVGHPNRTMEFVLAGTAVDEAVAAESKASAGQVVASQGVLQMAGLPHAEPFRVVEEVPPVPRATQPLYWDSYSQSAVDSLLRIAPAFIPKALVERLKNPNTQFVAEHRPATSMFVKFEGIDFQSDQSGELLQQYYQWVWEVVERYGGQNSHVNRMLTGDKGSHLHIIFGAPIAPDAPEQAIRCALALQRQRPNFISRQQIGLSAGRVFACAVGSQNRREYTTVGRVVNLSSRLTDLCQDGSVLTDQQTAERVRDIFVFDTTKPVALKGVSKLVSLYVPLEEKTIAAQARSRLKQMRSVPLGRDEELAVLESYLDDGLQGRGETIAIFGPFGSGQVGLLSAGVHYWQMRKGRVETGACQQHLIDEPFTPWHMIWRSLFEISDEMTADEVKTAVKEFMSLHLPHFDGDPTIWGALLGFSAIQSTFVTLMSLEQRHQELFAITEQMLRKLAEQRPLLLILEDIHWADMHTIKLIDTLATQLTNAPITLIVTYRESSDFQFFTPGRHASYKKLHLADLDPERALEIIKKRLKVNALPKMLEQRLGIRDRDGRLSPVNPLFLEESLKFMLSEGVLNMANQRLRLQETAMLNLQVPDRVYAILLSRLDQLSPDGRSLLQTAAVIGRSFDLDTLVAVSQSITHEEASDVLAMLAAQNIIEQDGFATENKFIFSHALAHDVVYQSIPYARRQKLHASIGDLIVRNHQDELDKYYPLLAYHFGQTDRHETGLIYAIAAADQAAERYENEAASSFYRRAVFHLSLLNEKLHWQTAVHVLLSWANVNRLRGELGRATLTANDALKLSLLYGEPRDRLSIYTTLAEIKYDQARYSDAVTLADKVINSASPIESKSELAQAYLIKAIATDAMHNPQKALDLLDRVEEMSMSSKNKSQLIVVWQAMSIIYRDQCKTDLAIQTGQDALSLARENRSERLIGGSLHTLSRIYLRLGRSDEALEFITEAVQISQHVSTNWLAHLLTHRAAVYVYVGQPSAALIDLKQAVSLLESMDDPLGLLRARLTWGMDYCRAREDWDAAQHQLVQVGDIISQQKAGSEMHMPEAARLWLGLCQTALFMEQLDQAKDLLAKGMRVIEVNKLNWWRPAALYLRGLIERQEGEDMRRAQNTFKTAVQQISQGGNPDELPLLLWQLAEITDDEGKKMQLWEACIVAAQTQARYFDKLSCYKAAGPILSDSREPRLQKLGNFCLAFVESATS